MIVKKHLTLASRSPRRQVLLKQLGLKFDVVESFVDENIDHIQIPIEHVTILSQEKAIAVGKQVEDGFVIGADTIVVLDGKILGKPEDENEAIDMLCLLSERVHKVFTGFTILDRPSNKMYSDYEITDVTFRKIYIDEIKEYVRSGSPLDKAGAYGIQDDYGAVFVQKIDGCFYNVVGFPLTKFYLAMERFQKELGII
jgi:septum formation protein